MTTKVKLNFGSEVLAEELLGKCRPQIQLYIERLLGCQNNTKANFSKFKARISNLFPVALQNQSLEFRDIEIIEDHETDVGFRANIKLEWFCYNRLLGILYIQQRREILIPVIKFPKLTSSDTLIVNGLEKVLLSQLERQPGIHIEADDNQIQINFLKNKSTMFQIRADHKACYAICEGREVGLLQALMSLGVTKLNIIKVLYNVKTVVFSNNEWREINFRQFAVEDENSNNRVFGEAYGWRRNTRYGEKIIPLNFDRNAVVIEDVIGFDKRVILKAGERMVWNIERLGCGCVRIAEVAAASTIKFLNNVNEVEMANLTTSLVASKLRLVDLELNGRSTLNAITKQTSCNSISCVTKRDLILIWNMLNKGKWSAFQNAAKVRIVRGIGDIIIEKVERVLRCAFTESKALFTIESFLDGNISLIFRGLQASIDKLFTSSGLCQFADQVNSLAELSHKRRLTCLGEGGVTVQTAETSMREVQSWHFGRICPIESPEGQNVGLVTELAMGANIRDDGHIVVAYNKVRNGLVTNQVIYLNWFDSRTLSAAVKASSLKSNNVLCLLGLNFKRCKSKVVDICLPKEIGIFSPAVNLIPFLGHNDPTRALMAANMMKQAVPLLVPQCPLVGTGMEDVVMKLTNHNIVASSKCVVASINASQVVVFELHTKMFKTYKIPEVKRTNQGMCSRIRVVVKPRQLIAAGDIIGECQSSFNGEMSLGVNLTVAFMCWRGLNYEDSVLLSEDVVARGDFLSFHLMELEVNVYKTKIGEERTTDKLPTISSKHKSHLPVDGVVVVGTVVRENDVLVGKLRPTQLQLHSGSHLNTSIKSIDEACAAAYNAAGNDIDKSILVSRAVDSSFLVPVGISFASVIEVSRFGMVESDFTKGLMSHIGQYKTIRKRYFRRIHMLNKRVENGIILNSVLEDELILLSSSYDYEMECLFQSLWLYEKKYIEYKKLDTSPNISRVIDIIKIKLLVRKSIQAGDKICGRHGNKGVISRVLAREDMPYMADGTPVDIVLNPLSVPSRMNFGQILETRLGLISKRLGLEFKRILEIFNSTKNTKYVLKLARLKLSEICPKLKVDQMEPKAILTVLRELADGVKITCSPFEKISEKRIESLFKRVGLTDATGQMKLYDGRTGLEFNRKITVGSIYIFKLNHMVSDKVCARATGSYSVITQQPLKGRANKGGQRLGEMEVWALQAHGAAYTLKEVLTTKCDDVIARRSMFTGIMHNSYSTMSTWSESFLVLIKEMRALCISVKIE